ncbi:MAG TPA: carboxypeptidase-like regulatory domain-containing protein [Longimicrobium sp.]|nr:carboxypeptidase-like regulatory domain-containing protein [Longimicrobium sp.]
MDTISPRRTAFRLLLLAACVMLAASPASAQRLRVTLTDAETGRPVAGAMVRVQDVSGTVVAGAFTNGDGVVRVRITVAGPHTVHAAPTGYVAASQPVAVGAEGEAVLALAMAPKPFGLDTLVVVRAVGPERGGEAFARRQSNGRGVFLDSAYVASKNVPFVSDLLYGVPDVYLQARGHYFHPRSQRSWGCMVQLVDGLPYYGAWPAFERNLFRALRIDRVVAVEVYREFDEVPPELQPYAWGERRCGLILYWTDIGYRLDSPNVPRP